MGNCFLSKIGSTVPTIKIDVLRATTSASSYTIVTEKEYDVLLFYNSGYTGGSASVSGTSSNIDVWVGGVYVNNSGYDAGHWFCTYYCGSANKGEKIPTGTSVTINGVGSGGAVCYGIYYE